MARVFSLAALVVGGIIVADILLHPQGTSAAAQGFATATRGPTNALLGVAS